jgi:DNA uptake protein ComE-like DNA-binding protein
MTAHGAQFTSAEQDEVVAYLADQLPEKVDVNLLSERLLETKLGFTPEEAAVIVAWRTTNGRFRSVDQLLSVPGVATERVNTIRRRLVF